MGFDERVRGHDAFKQRVVDWCRSIGLEVREFDKLTSIAKELRLNNTMAAYFTRHAGDLEIVHGDRSISICVEIKTAHDIEYTAMAVYRLKAALTDFYFVRPDGVFSIDAVMPENAVIVTRWEQYSTQNRDICAWVKRDAQGRGIPIKYVINTQGSGTPYLEYHAARLMPGWQMGLLRVLGIPFGPDVFPEPEPEIPYPFPPGNVYLKTFLGWAARKRAWKKERTQYKPWHKEVKG